MDLRQLLFTQRSGKEGSIDASFDERDLPGHFPVQFNERGMWREGSWRMVLKPCRTTNQQYGVMTNTRENVKLTSLRTFALEDVLDLFL